MVVPKRPTKKRGAVNLEDPSEEGGGRG